MHTIVLRQKKKMTKNVHELVIEIEMYTFYLLPSVKKFKNLI